MVAPAWRVGFVVEADAGAGVVLDDDLVAVMGELARAGRGEADAVFVGLDLLGNADLHWVGSCWCLYGAGPGG